MGAVNWLNVWRQTCNTPEGVANFNKQVLLTKNNYPQPLLYPFSSTPLEDPTTLRGCGLLKKAANGIPLSKGTDDGFDNFKHKDEKNNYVKKPGHVQSDNDWLLFIELSNPTAYRSGCLQQMGWVFDFRLFFNKYRVMYSNNTWGMITAPSKEFIKKLSNNPKSIISVDLVEKGLIIRNRSSK